MSCEIIWVESKSKITIGWFTLGMKFALIFIGPNKYLPVKPIVMQLVILQGKPNAFS